MKHRVLQLIGSFNQGGSERQALALTRLLKGSDEYDVFLATLSGEGVLRGDAEAMGFSQVPQYPLTSFFDANFIAQVRKCAEFLKDSKIDIIHTHDFYTNVFGMAAATLAGVQIRIASKRETGGMRTPAQELVEKLAFRRSSAIVANSDAVRKYLVKSGVSAKKIYVIYNGLDVERFTGTSPDRAGFHDEKAIPSDPDTTIVTLVANLRHEIKNVPMLLRATSTVIKRASNVHFVIAGEGGLMEGLMDLAKELGVSENTHFIGRCSDIPKLLASSDICVLTSTAEGFSNSILEYMAAGKPVVATDVGGACEAIEDGMSGYLIGSDDSDGLAERLLGLLNDPERSIRFGDRGREIVAERFSEAAQLAKTLELYGKFAG